MSPRPAPEEPDGNRRAWWMRLRAEFSRIVRDAFSSALGQAIVLGVLAALALAGSGFSALVDLPQAVVVALAALTIALVVPMAILFARSRQRRRLEELTAARESELDMMEDLRERLADVTEDAERERERAEKLERLLAEAYTHDEASAGLFQVLADLFAVLQGGDDIPTPAWVQDSLAFERWLNDFTREIVQVGLRAPGEPAGLAIVRRRDGQYEFAHRTAHVPSQIVKLDGRPARRDLEECLREHAPEAICFYAREISGDAHWVVIFPSREVEWPYLRPLLQTLAEVVVAAYRRRVEHL